MAPKPTSLLGPAPNLEGSKREEIQRIMSALKQPGLYQDLEKRGIVKQVTDPELSDLLSRTPLTVYAGFDPTSDSLHIGSLLPLLTLKRFQLAGHRVIALIGGATGMIGDPSGKSQERQLMSMDQLKKNQEGITKVISRFLDLKGPNPALVTNNADWFKDFGFIDFLRDVGKHFTINHMMGKESVRARLEDREHGISYTEFSYMLLQAYDFCHLNQANGCRLQIGGSDQWGNITAGIELIRRMGKSSETVYGLTHPLVMKSDGSKFGKSEQGNVWLDAEKTSPYQFYQFLIQTADADVLQLLYYFTFLPTEQLHQIGQSLQSAPEKREAQRTLASELTRLVHGEEALQRAEKATQALFGTEIKDLDARTLLEIFSGAPALNKDKSSLTPGWALIDALVETGLCSSKGAARKDITAGGVYINNARIADAAAFITSSDLIASKYLVLRKGKKNYHLVSFN